MLGPSYTWITMTNSNTARAAAALDTDTLRHIARTLNAELEADMLAGVRGTQAHIGRIELATACANELLARGDGPKPAVVDVPHLVAYERVDGDATALRLSFGVMCF